MIHARNYWLTRHENKMVCPLTGIVHHKLTIKDCTGVKALRFATFRGKFQEAASTNKGGRIYTMPGIYQVGKN